MLEVRNKVRRTQVAVTLVTALLCGSLWSSSASAEVIQIVYTSDQHYGISRKSFRGEKKVPAATVNAAMVEAINDLPGLTLPPDDGVMAEKPVGWIDYVISTGDIANRMEGTPEKAPMTATACFELFMDQYGKGLKVKDKEGHPAELLAVPGNHDMTNAVCRTWRIEKIHGIYIDKETGDREDYTVTRDNPGEMGYDMPMEVMWSKSGTYLVSYRDGSIGLAEWKWRNKGAGQMYYAWDGEWTGDYCTITFEGNKAVIHDKWEDEYESEESWTYMVTDEMTHEEATSGFQD